MGEFLIMQSIKTLMKGIPSFCVRGIKISEHLGVQLKELDINIGKEAEMDIVNISCNDDNINSDNGQNCRRKLRIWRFKLEVIVEKIP